MEESHSVNLRSELATQQKRLRHLRAVVARNLQVDPNNKPEDIYFTINDMKTKSVIFCSDKIPYTANPTWKSFNLAIACNDENSIMMTSFVIKLWLDHEDRKALFMEWTVDLTGLVYLHEKVQYDGCKYPENSIIFGMHGGFYGAGSLKDCDVKYRSVDIEHCVRYVDNSLLRHSYTTGSLLRMHTVLRATTQTQAAVAKVRDSIERQLSETLNKAAKHSKQEEALLRVNQLRKDLEMRTMLLQSEKEDFEIQQTAFNKRSADLDNKFDTLQKDKDRLSEKRKVYFEARDELIKTSAQLVIRRKQLISELAFIYPICEIGTHFSISGVKLPDSEAFSGQDEVMIAVGLGFTCHLIQMISHFLDVPVRYCMEHRGSRSRIRDHIHDKLNEKERDFPLYSKGKEKFQFNYGVYLMNKNIGQLRYYCGLGTADLRTTLPNLKSLLELRLGVKFNPESGGLMLSEGSTQLKEVEFASNSLVSTESQPIAEDTNIVNSDSSEFEVLIDDTTKNIQPGKELFAGNSDSFFKRSLSSQSFPGGEMFPVDGDSDSLPIQVNSQNDPSPSSTNWTQEPPQSNEEKFQDQNYPDYKETFDPTFIVHKSFETKEMSHSSGGTFKTEAMLVHNANDSDSEQNDTET